MRGGIKGQRKNKECSRRGRESSTNNHRPPPLIVSERKLNIDQSKQRETMERGEIERVSRDINKYIHQPGGGGGGGHHSINDHQRSSWISPLINSVE